MRMRQLVLAVVALLLFSEGAFDAQQRDQPAAKLNTTQSTATIRGRVTAGDTGRPLRKALIRISPAGGSSSQSLSVITDNEGRYEIREEGAGRYLVTASKPGYVSAVHGQRRPEDPGQPIELRDGGVAERVNFTLQRGGVIVGEIFDEFGDPVVGAIVSPLQFKFQKGSRELVPAGGTAITNDIGEFRVFGLSPGDFIVSASARVPFGQLAQADAAFPATYYPGTPNVGEAKSVRVRAGTTVSGISLQVSSTRASRLSGIVVAVDGRPMTNAFLNLTLRATSYGVSSGQVKADGSFVLSGVPPGDYNLLAQTSDRGPDGMFQVAASTISVAGQDIDNIRVEAAHWVEISGRMTLDTDSKSAPSWAASRLSLVRQSAGDPFESYGGLSSIKADLTFELRGLAGDVLLRPIYLPSGWRVKTVRVGGEDVTDSGFSLPAGQSVEDVVVELTDRGPWLNGRAVTTRREPATRYRVVVFPQDPDRRSWQSRYITAAQPNADGVFEIDNLPAGEYFAAAFEVIAPGQEWDAEFLREAESRAVRFKLNPGERTSLDLTLAPP